MDETAIKIDGVYKDFHLPDEKLTSIKSHIVHPLKHRNIKTQHALKNVSVDIKKGEFFGIVGRNGSGKSTLLKIIAGIYQPTKGSVAIDGKLVPFIELGVGFNPELTGKENIYLNGALLGFRKKEIDAQYDDIVEFAELKPFMSQKLKNYSSGMQVRLAFSMAVRAKAEILLIDEVLAVGDADFQRKCFNYFSRLKNEKTTVVFVSHDMNAVREYCDRAMLIENSEVVKVGSTDTVSEKYLQLFMQDNISGAIEHAGQDRWGDRSATIRKVVAQTSEDKITVTVEATSSKGFEKPVVGFRIRDAAGNEITGTNTKQEHIAVPELTKNKTVKIKWELPNILRDGEYIIDVALQYQDEITVADWWNEAARISIKKARHLPYVVDPGFAITVE